MLPDIDGYEVCRSLKTPGGVSVIPVVIVTARLTAENRIESFAAGADDYVPKPYTPDQIFEALEQSDAWKDLLDAPAARRRGRRSTRRDDGETLRHLAHLRRLLQARCGMELDGDRPDQLGDHGRSGRASTPGRGSGGEERVATLAYSLTPEALTLTIRDEAGWLAATHSAAERRPGRRTFR